MNNQKGWLNKVINEADLHFEISAEIKKQLGKGQRKYGIDIISADLDELTLLNHAIEESTDQLIYLIALRKKFLNERNKEK